MIGCGPSELPRIRCGDAHLLRLLLPVQFVLLPPWASGEGSEKSDDVPVAVSHGYMQVGDGLVWSLQTRVQEDLV